MTDANTGVTGSNYIVKYSSGGQVQWLTKVENIGDDSNPVVISIDSNDNLYISGSTINSNLVNIYSASTSGPTGALGTQYSMTISSDAYIVKYSQDGQVRWLTKVAGNGGIYPINMSIDSNNNLYISGGSSNSDPVIIYSANSDGPTGTLGTQYSMTGDYGATDSYIVKYSSELNYFYYLDGPSDSTDLKYIYNTTDNDIIINTNSLYKDEKTTFYGTLDSKVSLIPVSDDKWVVTSLVNTKIL
jgi:hypothetical protein